MNETLKFTFEDGAKSDLDITVYALSTCAFCKRGLEFLRKNSIKFKFLYVDALPLSEKTSLKKELETKFNKPVNFPFLVINDEKVLVGFNEDEWLRELI